MSSRPKRNNNRAVISKRNRNTGRAVTRPRRSLAIGVVAVAVAILAVVAVVAFRGTGSRSGNAVTTPTAFSLPALDGDGQVRLADYLGTPTVVNFFASWCEVCDAELPGFKTEADALKGKVAFIGVDSLETGDPNYMPRRHHLAGSFAALARDAGGSNHDGLHAALGGGNSMPLTAFYDANGKLLDVERTGLVPVAVLHAKLRQLYGIS